MSDTAVVEETDEEGFPLPNSGTVTEPVQEGQGEVRAKRQIVKPTYAAEKVAELPADLTMPRSGPRTNAKFIEALQVAQSDAGEWYCVGTFESANGAKNALKRIQKGDTTIPAGEWDFEARRIEAPDSTVAEPKRWSKLYARSLG